MPPAAKEEQAPTRSESQGLHSSEQWLTICCVEENLPSCLQQLVTVIRNGFQPALGCINIYYNGLGLKGGGPWTSGIRFIWSLLEMPFSSPITGLTMNHNLVLTNPQVILAYINV